MVIHQLREDNSAPSIVPRITTKWEAGGGHLWGHRRKIKKVFTPEGLVAISSAAQD